MSWQLLAMGMHTIILIIPTFMFEIFHHQKNLKPPLKEKKKKRVSSGIIKSPWSTDEFGIKNTASGFLRILRRTLEPSRTETITKMSFLVSQRNLMC